MKGRSFWLKAWRYLNPARRRWMPLRVWWWLKPPIRVYVKTSASLDQTGFQFYEDGTESGATAVAAEDTNATLNVDTNYLIRLQVDDTASGGENNVTLQLQYFHTQGTATWTNVTGSSSVVQSAGTGSGLTDGNDTTARLTAPSGGSFITPNSGQDEVDGLAGQGNDIDFVDGTHDYVEVVYAITIVSADVANNDTIDFRVVRSGGSLDNWTLTPRATVSEAAGGQTLTGSAAFTPTLSFPQGALLQEQFLTGTAAFTPALSFGTGSVDLTISGGAAFTPSLSFPTGKFAGAWTATVSEFTYFTGATFTPALNFPQGNVDSGAQAQNLTGAAAFTPTLSFPTGSVDLTVIGGAAFAPTLSFPQGALGLSNTLVGSTFAPTLAFPTGTVQASNDLVGATFTPTLSFPTGSLGLLNTLTGATFAPTLSFPQGNLDAGAVLQTLVGPAAFTPSLAFPQGNAANRQTLSGSTFAPALSFPTGVFGVSIQGAAAFTPTLVFGAGQINLTIVGSAFAPILSFPTGNLAQAQTLVGSAFAPALTFPAGTLVQTGATFWSHNPVDKTDDPVGFTKNPVAATKIGPDDTSPW